MPDGTEVPVDGTLVDMPPGRSWGFSAVIPRSSIQRARRRGNIWWAIGVHTNFRGAWPVNGAASGIVQLELRDPVHGRATGIRIKIRQLGLGLEDADGFLAALRLAD